MKHRLTPHGPGFSFVDAFERTGVASGVASLKLNPTQPYFADHFPGNPLMPAVLLAECAAQGAGILWMQDTQQSEKPVFLASIDQFRILGPARPGDTLTTKIELIKELGDLAQFEAECSVNQQVVARGRFMLSRQLKEAVKP